MNLNKFNNRKLFLAIYEDNGHLKSSRVNREELNTLAKEVNRADLVVIDGKKISQQGIPKAKNLISIDRTSDGMVCKKNRKTGTMFFSGEVLKTPKQKIVPLK